jgi:hypothetical protein
MLPVLLMSVLVVAVSALVVAAVFLDTAFHGEPRQAERSLGVFAWRPPFLRGEALRAWAAETAERIASRHLLGERTAATPAQLAAEIEEGAGHAMLPLARQAELERVVACPEAGQGAIGLTAPEALAIADYLRTHLPRSEGERIRALVIENSEKLAQMRQGELAPEPLPCPLAAEDNVCCAYAVRPLRCRPLHAITIAQTMESRAVEQRDETDAAAERNRYEYAVEQGIETGLSHALESAGLDSQVYELNGALAVALATPQAARRWASGEHLFQDCVPAGSP